MDSQTDGLDVYVKLLYQYTKKKCTDKATMQYVEGMFMIGFDM